MSGIELTIEDARETLRSYLVQKNGEERIEVEVDGRQNTVKPRPVHEYERDLVDRMIESSIDGSVSGAAVPIKGRWVHGWLNVHGEDYINSIWHGYQFFLRYLEVSTSKVGNISTHNRSPGTYDSMYRYLLMLEDLELIKRYRREEVDPSEYDFNVPEEFRTRTYVKLSDSFEGNEEKWDNPVKELYGEETEEDEPEPVSVGGFEITPEEEGEGGEVEEREDQEDDSPTLTEMIERAEEDDDADDLEAYDLPDTGASIDEFEDRDLLKPIVSNKLDEAIEQAFDESPIPIQEVDPGDLGLYRLVVVGPWALGEATPGETTLDLFVGIDNSSVSLSPTFITQGVSRILPRLLENDNAFEDIFNSYSVQAAYSAQFTSELRSYIESTQDEELYYSFRADDIEEI
jgi:hypothetical protein